MSIEICKNCNKEFVKLRKDKKYCSKRCQNENYNNHKEYDWRSETVAGTVGAISEILVCADLLRKGYEVFRAISPSCSCDIILLNNEGAKRVEVRTARKNLHTGHISVTKGGKYDILAIVIIEDNLIIYEPELLY